MRQRLHIRPGRGIAENVPNQDIKRMAEMIRDEAMPFTKDDFAARVLLKNGIPATEETIRAAQVSAVELLAYMSRNTRMTLFASDYYPPNRVGD